MMQSNMMQAALKLCHNLLNQLEPEDARVFAAFVLAKISIDSQTPIETSLRTLTSEWAKIVLANMGDGNRTIDSGNCTCLAACIIKHTTQGPIVIHYGAACTEFKNRFPYGAPTRAQDGMGWDNWTDTASEKHTPSTPTPTGDDTADRFRLLEFK